MTRAEAIAKLWDRIEPRVYITRAQWERVLADGWEVVPHFAGGDLSHITMVKGDEFHFESFTARPFTLAQVRACVEPIIARYGQVRVVTPKDEPRQRRFNEAVGFVKESESEFFVHYKMTKFGRSRQCQPQP